MPTTYILKDKCDRIYVGSTTDMDRRIQEHLRGHTYTTRRLEEIQLVWHKELPTLELARETERKIKKWKSRRMIDMLINGTMTV